MSDLRTAAQQALEALEAIDEDPHGTHSFPALSNDAITALRAALAQDKQEWTGIPGTNVRVKVQPPLMWGGRLIPQTDTPTVPRGVFYTPPECKQKEQEPVAWIQPDHLQKARQAPFLCRVEPTQRCADFVPFYTHPPRREWRGLTEEEIGDVFQAARNAKLGSANDNSRHRLSVVEIARAVEQALKERNNG